MKLFSADQIRRIDQLTIQNEPISSTDLMERAATACAGWIEEYYEKDVVFHIFCGMGNNGGDGLALSRLLSENGFAVETFIIAHRSSGSDDFNVNLNRLDDTDVPVKYVNSFKEMPEIHDDSIAIDAILGIGLAKPLRGIIKEVVHGIQEGYDHIISIDVPTGLPSDLWNSSYKTVLKASHTLTFQFPKLTFMLPATGSYTGDIHILDIGLDEVAILEEDSPYYLTEDEHAEMLRPMRPVFAHKGNFGHALIVAGKEGMMGAAVLATKACLRSGAGLVTAHVPSGGRDILQISAPEAMVQLDHNSQSISSVPVSSRISAIGIGPGIGREASVFKAIEKVLTNVSVPVVLDADALHLIGSSQAWHLVPEGTVVTPHLGEFHVMLGKEIEDPFELIESAREWAVKHKCVLVLKGAYTAIFRQDGEVHFNSTGNPAMATGGSGDVLTGIITGLLAQGLTPFNAARFGVWLHGCTGEQAAARLGEHAVVASDLIREMF